MKCNACELNKELRGFPSLIKKLELQEITYKTLRGKYKGNICSKCKKKYMG